MTAAPRALNDPVGSTSSCLSNTPGSIASRGVARSPRRSGVGGQGSESRKSQIDGASTAADGAC